MTGNLEAANLHLDAARKIVHQAGGIATFGEQDRKCLAWYVLVIRSDESFK
jgi:hypothetical protein